jgi:hypothetical protein
MRILIRYISEPSDHNIISLCQEQIYQFSQKDPDPYNWNTDPDPTPGSGSCFFLQRLSRRKQKICSFKNFFLFSYCRYIYISLQR